MEKIKHPRIPALLRECTRRTFRRAHPAMDEDMRRGDFSGLLGWLREVLHRHGRKFQPRELVQQSRDSRVLEFLHRGDLPATER